MQKQTSVSHNTYVNVSIFLKKKSNTMLIHYPCWSRRWLSVQMGRPTQSWGTWRRKTLTLAPSSHPPSSTRSWESTRPIRGWCTSPRQCQELKRALNYCIAEQKNYIHLHSWSTLAPLTLAPVRLVLNLVLIGGHKGVLCCDEIHPEMCFFH